MMNEGLHGRVDVGTPQKRTQQVSLADDTDGLAGANDNDAAASVSADGPRSIEQGATRLDSLLFQIHNVSSQYTRFLISSLSSTGVFCRMSRIR